MAALIYPPSQNAVQKTLGAQLLAGVTAAATLNNVTGIQNKLGMMVIDRVDTNGVETPSKREYIKFTGTSGSTVVTLTRNADGSGTDQDHAIGSIVEFLPDVVWAESINTALGNVVDTTTLALDTTKVVDLTTAQELTNKTLTSPVINTPTLTATNSALTTPKITTSINDANGNEVIKTPATASAVNEITVTNASAGNKPQIAATGGDTDISLYINAKGAGQIQLAHGYFQTAQAYTPAGAGITTLDLSLSNEHVVTMPANTQTLAISNAQVGQKFIVSINNVTSQGALTWFTTIRWATGAAPTLTGTNGKRDTFGFIVTGAGTYDGFIVGQNI